jgi:hypothetical protein
MGMFDDIIVPKSYLKGLLTKKQEKLIKDNDYQTKSLENFLGQYKVYRQKLYVKQGDWKNGKGGEWIKDTYTGKVNFYTSLYDKDKNMWWSEYEFTFNSGVLDRKKLIKFEIQETAEEKEKLTKMWETEQEIFNFYRESSVKYRLFSFLEKVFLKATNWARKMHRLPLSLRKEAYEKSGRLKSDPKALDLYMDV